MSVTQLSPEAVAAYKTLMTEPKKHGIEMPALSECFEDSADGTPKHILFDQYIELIQRPLPKIFFYIIMVELYPDKMMKCASGHAGYSLKIRNLTI